ncbi:hypothetical protein [Acidiphilium sp.]|uniref:hypothetical protein n=1 Tax=Acidiphilium sp. TaxID=527 RepID=UPI003D0053C3
MSLRSMVDRANVRLRKQPGLGCGAVALAAALLSPVMACAATGPSVCLDQANPFYHIDRAVALAVGSIDHVTPRFITIDTRDGSDALNAQKPKFFARLASRCDLVMGFPVETGYPTLPEGVKATQPYAATGFVIAALGSAPGNFATLPPKSTVGVTYLTVPTTYFGSGHGTVLAEHQYSSPAAELAALQSHEIDAALIWQPWLNQHLAAHPAAISQRLLTQPHAKWSMVALYRPTPASHRVAVQFDRAIRQLTTSGRLQRLIAPYNLP